MSVVIGTEQGTRNLSWFCFANCFSIFLELKTKSVAPPPQVVQPWAEGVKRRRKVVVVFDTGDDNFRHDLSPSYKKHRAETPEALR